VSLILEALKKLERDRQVEGRTGFLVMASRPWPSGEGHGLFWASLALAGVGLAAMAGAGLWWWSQREPASAVQAAAAAPVPPAAAPRAPLAAAPALAPAAPAAIQAPPATRPFAIPMQEPSRGRRRVAPPPEAPATTKVPAAAVAAAEPAAEPAPVPSAFRLTAISERDGRPMAILNDRLVFEGDSFDGITVQRIGGSEIEIEIQGARRVIHF
jgi:general secretion pathway protein B